MTTSWRVFHIIRSSSYCVIATCENHLLLRLGIHSICFEFSTHLHTWIILYEPTNVFFIWAHFFFFFTMQSMRGITIKALFLCGSVLWNVSQVHSDENTFVLLFLFCRGHKWKWLMRLLPGQSEAILPCWITKISSKKHLTSTLQSDRRDMIGLDFSFVHNFIFLTFLITSGLKVFYVIHVMYIFHQVLQQQIKCSWYSCIMTFLCDIYWEFVPIVVIATLLLLSIYMNALTSQDIHCALCRIWNIRSLTEKFVFPLGIIFVCFFCCWQPTNFCKKYNLFEKKKP